MNDGMQPVSQCS